MIGVGLPGIGEALEVGPQHDRRRVATCVGTVVRCRVRVGERR